MIADATSTPTMTVVAVVALSVREPIHRRSRIAPHCGGSALIPTVRNVQTWRPRFCLLTAMTTGRSMVRSSLVLERSHHELGIRHLGGIHARPDFSHSTPHVVIDFVYRLRAIHRRHGVGHRGRRTEV